jgi:Zn-dependent protease with chaperone function
MLLHDIFALLCYYSTQKRIIGTHLNITQITTYLPFRTEPAGTKLMMKFSITPEATDSSIQSFRQMAMHLAISFCLLAGTMALPLAMAEDNNTQLRAMMTRIISQNGLDLPQSVVDASVVQKSDVVNAYTDGSKVVMTTALWNKLTTPDAKAFVVGHEMGHITNRHIQRGMTRKVGFTIFSRLASAFISNPLASLGAQYGAQLVDLKFDRGQEYQADDSGVAYIMKAGYNKNAAIDVFRVLKEASQGGNQIEFTKTHPLPDSRIQTLTEKYDLKAI